MAATVTGLIQRLRDAPQRGLADKLRANAAAWYGMLLAHLGIAVFIVGVTLVKGYESERDVRLEVGQSVDVAGVRTRSAASRRGAGPNYDARARRSTSRATASRSRCCIRRSAPIVTRPDDDRSGDQTRLTRDLYVSLGEPVTANGTSGAWGVPAPSPSSTGSGAAA